MLVVSALSNALQAIQSSSGSTEDALSVMSNSAVNALSECARAVSHALFGWTHASAETGITQSVISDKELIKAAQLQGELKPDVHHVQHWPDLTDYLARAATVGVATAINPVLGAVVAAGELVRLVQAEDTQTQVHEQPDPIIETHVGTHEVVDVKDQLEIRDITGEFQGRNLQNPGACQPGVSPKSDGSFAVTFGTFTGIEFGYGFLPLSALEGGYVFVGSTSVNGNNDIFIAEVNKDGDVVQMKMALASGDDRLHGIARASDGGFITTGMMTTGKEDILVIRWSRALEVVWAKLLVGSGTDYALNIVATSEAGYFILVGYSNTPGNSGGYDCLIAKIREADGGVEWVRTIGATTDERCQNLAATPDGGVVLTGYTIDPVTLNDLLVMDVTRDGDIRWVKSIGSTSALSGSAIQDFGNAVAVLPGTQDMPGDYLVAGYGAIAAGNSDMILARLRAVDGNVKSKKTIGGTGSDQAISIVPISDGSDYGGYYVGGYTSSVGAGSADFVVGKFNADNALVWGQSFGALNADTLTRMAVRGDELLMFGSTVSFGATGKVFFVRFPVDRVWKRLGSGVVSANAILQDTFLSLIEKTPVLVQKSLSLTINNAVLALQDASNLFKSSQLILDTLDPGGALNLPLNYKFSYPLYPNGPFKGIVQTPQFSVDLSAVPGMSYDFIGQKLVYTPLGQLGARDLSLTVTAVGGPGVGSWYSIPFTLTLCVQPSNYSPPSYFRYALNPEQAAVFMEPYALSFTDLLYPNATVTAVTGHEGVLPPWLAYNVTQNALTGLPEGNTRGKYWVDVSFKAGSVEDTVTLVINVPNTAPFYTGPLSIDSMIGRSVIDLSHFFNDLEEDDKTYRLGRINNIPAPSFFNIDPQSGRLTVNSVSGDQGSYALNVICTDVYGEESSQTITVNLLNRAPVQVIPLNPPILVTEGSSVAYSIPRGWTQDPDLDLMTPTVTCALPRTYDPSSGIVAGPTNSNDRGEHVLMINVDDGHGGVLSRNVTFLRVNGVPVRDPSVVLEVEETLAGEILTQPMGESFELIIPHNFYQNPMGDMDEGIPLTYELVQDLQHQLPAGLAYDAKTRKLSGTLKKNDHQPFALLFAARDQNGGAALFELNFRIPNLPPVFTKPLDAPSVVTVKQTKTYPATRSRVKDPEGDEIECELTPSYPFMTLNPDDCSIELAPTVGFGLYNVTLQFIDGFGGVLSRDLSFPINGLPQRNPTLDPALQQTLSSVIPTARVGEYFEFTIPANYYQNPVGDIDEGVSVSYVLASGMDAQLRARGLSYDELTRKISGVLVASAYVHEPFGLSLIAVDAQNGATPFELRFQTPNTLPQPYIAISDQHLHAGQVRTVVISNAFKDADGDVWTPQLTSCDQKNLLSFASLVGNAMIIAPPPGAELEPGAFYCAAITVEDGYQGTAQVQTKIFVENQGPVAMEALLKTISVIAGQSKTVQLSRSSVIDPEGRALSTTLISDSSQVTWDPSSWVITVTTDPLSFGMYNLTLTFSDPQSAFLQHTMKLSIDGLPRLNPDASLAVSRTPEGAILTSPVGEYFEFTIPANYYQNPVGDIDEGVSVSYVLASGMDAQLRARGLSYDELTRKISGVMVASAYVHEPFGLSLIAVDAQNGATPFELRFQTPNSAPVKGNWVGQLSGNVGQKSLLVISSSHFSEKDGDPVTYALEGEIPPWVSIDGNVVTLNAPPVGTQGTYTGLWVVIRDTSMGELRLPLTVLVANTAPSVTPGSIPSQIALTQEEVAKIPLAAVMQDGDGDRVTLTVVSAPSFVKFNANDKTLEISPTVEDKGPYSMTLRGVDPFGASVDWNITTVVNAIPTLNPSVPMQPSSIATTPVGTAFSYTFPPHLFKDFEQQSLTITLNPDLEHPTPSWISYDANTQTLSGTPDVNSHKKFALRFQVSDGVGGNRWFVQSFETPNSAPVLRQEIADQVANVGEVKTLVLTDYGVDPDGDPLRVSLESKGAQSLLSVANGVATVSARSGHQGDHPCVAVFADSYGGTHTVEFTVHVPNQAPHIEYLPEAPHAAAQKPWSLALDTDVAVDPNQDLLRFSVAGMPNWMHFNPDRRVFSGTPQGINRGVETLKIKVSDSFGGMDTQTMQITVENSAPENPDRFIDQQINQAVDAPVTFRVSPFFDVDGDFITYTAGVLAGKDMQQLSVGIEFDPIALVFRITPKAMKPDNYLLAVTATDPLSASTTKTFNLAISAAPPLEETNFTQKAGQYLIPAVTGVLMLSMLSMIVAFRRERLRVTAKRVKAWADQGRTASRWTGEGDVTIESLKAQLKQLLNQLKGHVCLENLLPAFTEFAENVKQYYARCRPEEAVLMTALPLKEVFIALMDHLKDQTIARNQEERKPAQRLYAAQLLHGFLLLILSEYTGAEHKLDPLLKTLFYTEVNGFIDRLTQQDKPKKDSELRMVERTLYELNAAREIAIYMRDTNNLWLIAKNSFSHILSPGALLHDIKTLVTDIPALWYITLLEVQQLSRAAKDDLSILLRLQERAAKNRDWRFQFGMVHVLASIIEGSTLASVKEKAIEGAQHCSKSTYLGLGQLGSPTSHADTRVKHEAVCAMQALIRQDESLRAVFVPYLQPSPAGKSPSQKSLLASPSLHTSPQGAAGSSQMCVNPLKSGGKTRKIPLDMRRTSLSFGALAAYHSPPPGKESVRRSVTFSPTHTESVT